MIDTIYYIYIDALHANCSGLITLSGLSASEIIKNTFVYILYMYAYCNAMYVFDIDSTNPTATKTNYDSKNFIMRSIQLYYMNSKSISTAAHQSSGHHCQG